MFAFSCANKWTVFNSHVSRHTFFGASSCFAANYNLQVLIKFVPHWFWSKTIHQILLDKFYDFSLEWTTFAGRCDFLKISEFPTCLFPVEWHQKGIAYVLCFLQKIRRRISWVRILHLYLMAEDILELLRNIFWGIFLKKKINSVALSCSAKLFSTRPPIIDSHSNSRHLQSFLFEISECACDMAKIVFSRWVISFRRHRHFRWALHLQRSNHRRVQWGILQRSHFPFCSPQPYSNPAAGRHTLIFRYVMSSFFFLAQ